MPSGSSNVTRNTPSATSSIGMTVSGGGPKAAAGPSCLAGVLEDVPEGLPALTLVLLEDLGVDREPLLRGRDHLDPPIEERVRPVEAGERVHQPLAGEVPTR